MLFVSAGTFAKPANMPPTIFTLSSFLLLSPGEIQQPEPWAPERGEVAFDDGSLEILVFDSADQLVGTLLLTLPSTPDAGPIQIDASFADGYVSTPLLLLDEPDLAAPEHLVAPNMLSDLPPDEALHRVRAMLAFVDADLTAGSPDAQAMTRKQCAVLFAVGGAVCATATITGQVGIALACWAGSVTAVCNCTKYIPIKLCDD
jgi:hypothetical protein